MTMLVVIKSSLCSVSFYSSVDIFSEAIICCPESIVFKEEAIFLPSCLRNNFPLISQCSLILCLRAEASPQSKCCFHCVHTTKLCVNFCSSIFKSNKAIPMGFNVAPLAVFTFNGFLIGYFHHQSS